MTIRGDWTLDELRAGLDGSPYSIPSASDRAATEMLEQLRLVTAEATTARHNLHRNYRVRLHFARRSREIHESNRVENLGPEDLSETHRILRSKQADEIEEAINRYAVITTLDADHRTMDVLGLHGAKLFADQLLGAESAHLAETDVREIHQLLMGQDYRGGAYKGWLNSIGDSEHVPYAPSDTPQAMHELMVWMNRVIADDCLPAPVAAAAVHAWLAHIHPFHDGNGRVSRLLANLIVGRAGLPPLIVQMVGDRNEYIEALQVSDQGGDLAPLVGIFLRTMRRAVQDMRAPDFAMKLFEDEIQQRVQGAYAQWRSTFMAWLDEFGGALTLHGLRLRTDPREMIDQAAFRRIRQYGRGGGNSLVVGGIGNEDRYPDCRAYMLLEPTRNLFRYSGGEPTMTFLIYAPLEWSTRVHQRMGGEIDEILVKPDSGEGILVRRVGGRTSRMSTTESAEFVAQALSDDFRSGRARARYPTRQPSARSRDRRDSVGDPFDFTQR